MYRVGDLDGGGGGEVAVDVGDQVGFAVHLETHFAVTTDRCDDRVRCDLTRHKVQVRHPWRRSAWEHCHPSTFVTNRRVRGRHVE